MKAAAAIIITTIIAISAAQAGDFYEEQELRGLKSDVEGLEIDQMNQDYAREEAQSKAEQAQQDAERKAQMEELRHPKWMKEFEASQHDQERRNKQDQLQYSVDTIADQMLEMNMRQAAAQQAEINRLWYQNAWLFMEKMPLQDLADAPWQRLQQFIKQNPKYRRTIDGFARAYYDWKAMESKYISTDPNAGMPQPSATTPVPPDWVKSALKKSDDAQGKK